MSAPYARLIDHDSTLRVLADPITWKVAFQVPRQQCLVEVARHDRAILDFVDRTDQINTDGDDKLFSRESPHANPLVQPLDCGFDDRVNEWPSSVRNVIP